MGVTPSRNKIGNIIQTKSLVTYHQNIRSIKGKEELVIFLNDECNKPDIVCICVNELLTFSMLAYKMTTGFSRSIFRNGGVCILVKENILRGGIGKFQTVMVVTASVKKHERGGQGHTSESLLQPSAM
jgi:hypothetical protein